jgi:anti-sigma factor RsiW
LNVAEAEREPDAEPREAPTEELVAYLDGELDPKAAESLATRLSLDPKLRAEADALQRAWDILDVLPRPQPSSAFATRTVSQVVPVLTGVSGTQFLVGSAAATAVMPTRHVGIAFWVVSASLMLIAGAGGYVGRSLLAPPRPAAADPPLEDVSLMKNLRLYRNVSDMDSLKKLDSPEMFGDEGE